MRVPLTFSSLAQRGRGTIRRMVEGATPSTGSRVRPLHRLRRSPSLMRFADGGGALVAALLLMAFAEPAAAPDRPLPDAAQEARAQGLFRDIRCVVCQHESIADSPAGIAADMRRLVRDEVAAGRTDTEIEAGLVRRYGDYVLFRPPFNVGTLMLWLGPFLVVLIAGGVLLTTLRRRPAEAAPLTPTEEAALAKRLAERPDLDASSPHDHP